ncbi:MAG: hypothetical protein L6R40_001369 [Gallowayella cf. fulva]|nr:MAG: hypothetical protein L6R40_001369 [Xanthomendoza cf. fulva]
MPPAACDVEAATDTQAATFVDRLSVNGVSARRNKAPAVSTGLATYASSEMFEGPSYGKPQAKRWDHILNHESKAREFSSLKAASQLLKTPGLISLGGGLPSSTVFPFEHLEFKVPQPPYFSEQDTKGTGTLVRAGKHDAAEGKSIYDIHIAFNYGQGTGSVQLLRFVTEHTEMVHHPQYRDWQCTLTVGSTSALEMALCMFCNRGDYMMTEEYSFCTAIETAAPLGVKCLGIKMDQEGLLPSHMDDLLSNWSESERGTKKPFLLYTVPTGQNPTGATQSAQRRREIYACAQKHDIYILEDEPYYFLQMQPYTGPDAPDVPPPSSHDAFLQALVPSLLSLDTDGRVLRMDSFSKVIAPGMRTGWITASAQIVERYVRHAEVSTQMPSGVSQLLLFKLLDETWGHSGYFDWLIWIRLEYTRKRDNMVNACERFLPREVASWCAPAAGMFHWIKVDWRKHPLVKRGGMVQMLELEEKIWRAGVESGVLTAKGSWFRAEGDGGKDMLFRTTFAAAAEKDVVEAVERFGKGLRVEFELQECNGEVNGETKVEVNGS